MNNFVKQGEPILAVEDLSIDLASRGGRVKSILKNVSFRIFPGEIVGLIGESGSGKSMTSKAVLGMMPERMQVKSGLIDFEGKNLLLYTKKEMQKIRGSRLSLIPQDALHALNPVVKVGVQKNVKKEASGKCNRTFWKS
jgi:ABC-type glutathione transport system ATPase component